jgi:mannitol/fructose-specific phosphotransferase system IIA component (Ntr-type)
VAFPHLRVEGDPPPRIALGIIPQGIVDLQTAKPVQLVFLIISSVDHPEIQAKLLALVSKMASHKRTVDLLLSAGTPKRVVREIAAWENSLR